MKVTIHTYELVAALGTASRALAARPVSQIMEGVLLDVDGSTVTLTCTDGSMTIRTEATAFVSESGSAVIPCKLLADLAKKLPGDTVDIEVDGGTAKIRSGKSRTSMSVLDPKDFPDIGTYTVKHRLTIPAATVRSMVGSVAFSVCTDPTRLVLTGVYLAAGGGNLEMVALDGFRLSKATATGNYYEDCNAVVPGRTMTELARILTDDGEDCVAEIADTRITFTCGATVVSSVLISGEYIDYRKIIPDSFRINALVNKTDIQTAIDRAGILARSGHNNLVRLDITGDGIRITSRDESGQIEEDIHADVVGGSLSISFNAKYLQDVFKAAEDSDLVLNFNDATKPCVITPKENRNYLFLVLPVRVAA